MSLAAAAAAISSATNIAITTHINPDGDGVGAALALNRTLRAMGKQVRLLFPSTVASHLDFLPGFKRIAVLDSEAKARRVKPAELLISVDCGDLARLGAVAALRRNKLLNIDHHSSNDRFGDCNLVDPAAACTTIMVHKLLKRCGAAIDTATADCLYTGLVFDTGRFMHSNTSATVFRFAATLMGYGIDAAAINRKLTYTMSPALLKAQKLAIERLTVDTTKPSIAGMAFSQRDIAKLGEIDDWGELIEIPRSLRGVEVAYFLREHGDCVRCSLRSNPPYAVGTVASALGGGGHAQAAGCTVPGTLASVKRELLARLRQIV
ncbi:MAG: DHH family phosphoesterase [Planctomycetota bacterium]|jgi:phosphoesterase RecJ-like protein|nr:DHH family phosphoesterase [Planctomycetota bacterium]